MVTGIGYGDSCLNRAVIPANVEEVAEPAVRESLYRPDDEFLIDSAFAFPHPIDLAYRNSHYVG